MDFEGFPHKDKLREMYAENLLQETLELVLEDAKTMSENFQVLGTKAVLYSRLGNVEETEKAANAALILKPDSHEIHNIKGLTYFHAEKHEEAIASFNDCLALSPHYPVAVHKKIFSLAALGRFAEAVKTFEENDMPDFREVNWFNTIGYIYLEVGNILLARHFLRRSLRINPLFSHVHFNLARIYWKSRKPLRYILHKTFFWSLLLFEKNKRWKAALGKSFSRPHINDAKYFSRPGSLFMSTPQARETRSIFKLLHGMNQAALCNDTWKWFAINVPYDAVEKSGFRGDVDILLKRPRYIGPIDAGFTYRGFQVKTSIVNRNGIIKSSKRGKSALREIKKQLDVLKEFGCEQIFLLELFVLERGYSSNHYFPSSDIEKSIQEKAEFLKGLGYGYVVTAEEPSLTNNEDMGGVAHLLYNILPAENNSIGVHFQRLVDGIDTFLAEASTQSMLNQHPHQRRLLAQVGYCPRCKKLTMLLGLTRVACICGRCGVEPYSN